MGLQQLAGGMVRPHRVLRRSFLALLLSLAPAALPAAGAPPPDLRPYPPAGPGERRWLIPVPPSPAEAADQRVELIIGRTLEVDCNRHLLQGSVVEESVPGWGYPIQRVRGGELVVSTRMACPDSSRRQEFVLLGGAPGLLPVNPRLPIVVYAPQPLEVRWRLWRADAQQGRARPF